jgi:hypothetical protein
MRNHQNEYSMDLVMVPKRVLQIGKAYVVVQLMNSARRVHCGYPYSWFAHRRHISQRGRGQLCSTDYIFKPAGAKIKMMVSAKK